MEEVPENEIDYNCDGNVYEMKKAEFMLEMKSMNTDEAQWSILKLLTVSLFNFCNLLIKASGRLNYYRNET